MVDFDKETLELAKKWVEYKNDPIKFAEECCYLPTPGGDALPKLYEPQKRVIKDFYENHFLILLKSRQTGFSTLSQIITAHLCTFYENVIIGILSRDASESSDFCRKVEDILDKMDPWLRPKYKTKSVQSFILTNGCQLWSSAISPQNPGAVFRGKAITILFIDEAAHAPNIDEAWTAISMALSKSQLTAEKTNIPFGTVILSTPNRTQGIGKFFYDQWIYAINKESLFRPHKIHWKEIPDFVEDPRWYEKQCKILNNDPRRIAQELELKFVGAGGTLFSEEVQTKLQELEGHKPLEVINLPGGELHKLSEIKKGKFYLIGVDTASEAGGTDFSTVEVFSFEDMEHTLEYKGKVAVKIFVEKIVKLIARMVPNNIIIVENNSYGNQVMEELVYDETYQFNLFGEYKGKHGKLAKRNKNQMIFVPGLNTNSKTRPLILDALYTYVSENPEMIKSERLSLELLGLVDKINRIEADKGANDDLALALGFICYARHYCSDLLGNTEQDSHANETTILEESVSMISRFNEPDIPLKGNFQNSSFDHFKKDLENHILENLGNMKGHVNTFEFFRRADGKPFLAETKDD